MQSRLANLDALRGLAAMTVLLQHLLGHVWRAMPEGTGWLKAVALDYFDWGRFGVVLFFLISGYVIPLSFSGRTPLKKFVCSRACRLYPAFWISVAATVFAIWWSGGGGLDAPRIAANLTMAYPLFHEPALSGVYWTLIIELMFYGLAVGLFVIGALERPEVVALLALGGVGSAVLPMALNLAGAGLPVTLLGFHLSFLLLGSLIRQARQGIPRATLMACVVGIAIAAGLPLVSGMLTGTFTNYSLATPLGAMLSVAAAVAVFLVSWAPQFARPSLAALSLGAWSYSIYLLHEPIAGVAEAVIAPTQPYAAVGFVLLVTALTLVAAALVYAAVEKPAIAFGRTLVGGSGPRIASDVAP